ncbi:MAG TPA: two-component regulator propeller domain-containing protein, partial [Chitinophagaceae bacterium]|nr:two-component regulator propeller domain-containing protein [Chitinophagaceae bacterium]
MNPFVNKRQLFVCALGIIFIEACNSVPPAIPFPENETEFSQPVSMPFKFSEPKKITWETPNPDSIKPITETKLDFNKLPSKPFDIGDFHPLKKPMDEINFDLNHLPDTVFDLNKLPSQKFTFRISLLGQPIRTKATKPRIREKATQSIFEYGLDQGLATGGVIYTMFQDSRSFLWISTGNGLYRYDGENFDLYTATQGLTSFAFIHSLSEDHNGQIWAFSPGSIDIIDLNNGVLKHLVASQKFIVDDVFSSLVDSQGKIWFSTNKGIYIIDPENKTLKHLTIAQGLRQNEINSLLEDGWGNIWIGTKGGIDIVNTDKRTLKHITTSGSLPNRFFKDDKGRILIRTSGGGLNIVDLQKGILKQLGTAQGVSSDTIFRLKPDHLGHIWLASTAGIDIIDADSGEIKHLSKTDLGLSDSFLQDFLTDNQDHLWLSDGYAGVYIMNLNGGMFKMLSTQQGLSSNVSGGLFEDDQGRIWLDGGDILDLKAGTIKHIDSAQGFKFQPHLFLEDEKGQIWILSGIFDKGGAYIYNQKTGTLKHLTASNGLISDILFGIYKDKMDNIWLNCSGGISVYDPRNKTFKNLNASGGVSYDGVWSCMEDDQGNMWVLTIGNGLDVIDPKKETIKHFITG